MYMSNPEKYPTSNVMAITAPTLGAKIAISFVLRPFPVSDLSPAKLAPYFFPAPPPSLRLLAASSSIASSPV
jgi:hypothetical protein